jgi:hypothetical protein
MYNDILMQNGCVCRYHAKVASNLESKLWFITYISELVSKR